ncbi:MAG: methyltransferase family protein [Candidatus Hodarchaeota archaeon]
MYLNLWLLILAPEIFFESENLIFLLVLILTYFIGIIDTSIRPFSESIQKDATINPIYSLIILILFLINPVIVTLSFYESELLISYYLPFWDNLIVSLLGIFILVLGGLFVILGRYQLKQFGSGVLTIEDNHELITTGIFRYIRYPIYAGGIIGVFGFYFAFHSLITLIAMTITYFIIFRHRLLFEEKLLLEEFGDKYREYMKQTKKIIPFLY